jgi:hypothetical protein
VGSTIGDVYAAGITATAVRAATAALQFHEAQILRGNEAFPEAAVADPVADLEVWDEWRSGLRDLSSPAPYPLPGKDRCWQLNYADRGTSTSTRCRASRRCTTSSGL